MKKTWFLLPAAALLAAAPAQAQNLTWFGSTACFGSPSPSNRVGVSNCSLNSSTSTQVWWDTNDRTRDQSDVEFTINGYDNGSSTTNWPDGPTSSSINRSLAFGGVGSTQNLYLGFFDFNREDGEEMASALFSMRLFFDGGNVDLLNNLRIDDLAQSGPDGIIVSSVGNPVAFSIGAYNYEFRYTGFDNWNNNQPNTTANYCQGAVDNTLPANFGSSTERKLCGAIKYTGTTQVAEPATISLVAAGLMGLFGVARRRRNEG